MRVAEILSDLTSLQVCDPSAARALVSARADDESTQTLDGRPSEAARSDDPDLRRAEDLLELHAKVKLAHRDGVDPELERAREAVRGVLASLR